MAASVPRHAHVLTARAPGPAREPTPASLVARIAALEAELAALRRLQRQALVAAIVIVVGPGVVFSARELWQHRVAHRELASAFTEANIRSARQLGKKLRALGLERVGADHDGALWTCR